MSYLKQKIFIGISLFLSLILISPASIASGDSNFLIYNHSKSKVLITCSPSGGTLGGKPLQKSIPAGKSIRISPSEASLIGHYVQYTHAIQCRILNILGKEKNVVIHPILSTIELSVTFLGVNSVRVRNPISICTQRHRSIEAELNNLTVFLTRFMLVPSDSC